MARLRQTLVQELRVELLCALGRPRLTTTRVPFRSIGAERVSIVLTHALLASAKYTRGVTNPLTDLQLIFLRAVRAGVDAKRPATLRVGLGNRELQLHRGVLGERQRALQRQLLDHARADPLRGGECQLDKAGARHETSAEDPVIPQPRVRVERKATREQPAAPVGQGHPGAQEGMIAGRGHADRARLARTRARRGVEPVTLALEGVSRQADPAGVGISEQRRPVHVHAPRPDLSQRPQQTRGAALATAQRADHHAIAGILERRVERLLDPERQDGMRTHLDERASPLLQQRTGGLFEADRLAQVAIPVLAVQLRGIERPAGHRREERHVA